MRGTWQNDNVEVASRFAGYSVLANESNGKAIILRAIAKQSSTVPPLVRGKLTFY